jgi:hypothetical protein
MLRVTASTSTKAKVDSVQKPRIDDKAPIFKKP